MKSKTTLPALLVLAFFYLSATLLSAQSKQGSIFERLTAEEGAQLTLSTDISALMADKNNPEYQAGKLTTREGKSYDIQVKSRGKFRRKIAPIPPLKLKFKKKALQSEGLDTLNELKLVLPCFLDERGDELVIREYLAYRMFERMTNVSTRARLINLDILNTGIQNEPKYTLKAILIEDEEETEARLHGQIDETYGLTMAELQPAQAALTAMFNYMIGNTDWSVNEQRNVRFIRNNAGQLLTIPFDFDFAGLINAPYATPTAGLGLSTVRERHLMADGLSQTALDSAYHVLQDFRQEFNQICHSTYLSPSSAEKMVGYLDSFYQKMEKNNRSSFR